MKTCRQCKNDFPKTTDYFYKSKKGKDGLYSICKLCKNENSKKHASKPEVKEKRLVYEKNYREETKESRSQYMKEYREKNKEKLIADKKRYYQENKEKIAQHFKEYREENREKILEKDKKYREANKEKRSTYERAYRQTDKGKNSRYLGDLKFRSKKFNVEFTAVQRTEILKRDKWICQLCGIKVHDESEGNWNTNDKANIDHIIPLSKGGNSEPNNLQVLCRKCNNLKGDK